MEDHDHEHDHQEAPSDPALRVMALESLLVEKGLVDPAALDALIDTYEHKIGPRNGARVVARAWLDPEFKKRLLADAGAAIFPEGSVACKLIFTMATVAQVPYLAGSVEWEVNGAPTFGGTRSPITVRLLQIDVAVKDSRAAGTTGWVFGTFNYNYAASGSRPWDTARDRRPRRTPCPSGSCCHMRRSERDPFADRRSAGP